MKRLTTHVLDTAKGKPGSNIKIELYSLQNGRELIKTLTTNSDGRTDEPLLEGDAFNHGQWELVFHVGNYFSETQNTDATMPFLDEIPLRFSISSDAHYHVPLLVSPWSYSTYRGS
uniref:5-hydroxyisourate hydrolase n=1 Tax=uncultured Thiotrichaceae bacterium TaxID=298394 RepID=A0A6S6S8Y5_9GAMM|nr:MAG: 5-hydroxyisourate hydrolase [uncultured Thiotrichaceae bacterium]